MNEKVSSSLVIRKNRWSVVPMAAVSVAFVLALVFHDHALTSARIALVGFLVGIIASKILLDLFHMTETQLASIEVDERGIFADGKKLIAPGDLRGAAYLRPREKAPLLVYFPARRFWRSFGLEVESEAQGAEILARFGQDQARAAVRFRLASGFENPKMRSIATAVLVFSQSFYWFGMNSQLGRWLLAIYVLAIGLVGVSFLIPTYVTIGADGILLERRGTRRFIRFGDLLKIEEHAEYKDAIVLRLADSKQISLRTSIQDRSNNQAVVSDQTRALRKRLDVALEAFRNREAGPDVLLALGRANRSAHDWIAALAKTSTTSEYRVAPVTNEQLWSVAEDPAASADDRAAAVVALRATLDEPAKLRVRKTIEACAEPRLRVALDAAIGENDAQLEAALDALAENEQLTNIAKK
ncbi:MAG: hypothetical protein ABI461_06745 [Polyangiaceae bacterium]